MRKTVTDKVSAVYIDSYEYTKLRDAVTTLLESLGGIETFVKRGERVLLKPNMLSAKEPDMAVTTHPTLVRVVTELVQACGASVMIGDSPGVDGFHRVAEKTGISAVASESGAELVPFKETVTAQSCGIFKRIELARVYLEADKIINLPKLKTHEMMTLTCAVKNLFGAVVGTAKAGWHLKAGASRDRFARLLLEIYLLKKPVLNIVDAIWAMEGDGPSSGEPTRVNALIAGANAIAVDTFAARLAGLPPDLLYVEREAERMRLSGADPEKIEIVGANITLLNRKPFRLPKGLDTQFGFPEFLKKALRRHLIAYPVVEKELCVLCGICRDACPPKVITIKNSTLSIDEKRCIRCWCCRELCPENAVKTRRGTLMKLFPKLG